MKIIMYMYFGIGIMLPTWAPYVMICDLESPKLLAKTLFMDDPKHVYRMQT